MLVSGSMYIEACAFLPQLYLSKKTGGTIELRLGQFLVSMALSRVLRLIFWILMHFEGDSFTSLILADLIHTIILGDFVYLFFNSKDTILLV
jgi:hypothetical protein